ncbi:GNAT family N-acetyltransferase [Tenacibaculum aiptasiae]|uniref:GNAT family N-acetyltransferase n=1 Tax=Tenacibaculum aiptasiae TaxID=426481 RepID=A0A7J5ASM6_9FLAO|nr:GNAT family N-acetyltransferase [Tenacibaculum aiptasiae]KAB1160642.1 GNAT family N-acetyltransferase [Tenacibaculum aiptasiae]
MIQYKTTSSIEELKQIIALQISNLPQNLTDIEKKEQGFVTVQHSIEVLTKMHHIHPHIIAKHGEQVIGYALSMSKIFRNEIPVLVPMFNEIDKSSKKEDNYILMGQVCIDKNYRGKGIFRSLYEEMKNSFSNTYDAIITEIDANNTRSLNAHKAIGFKELSIYKSNNQNWIIVYMDI